MAAAAHDGGRQLALERGLDGGDEDLGVLVAPGRVLAERAVGPLLEVDEAGLRQQLAVVVVDPVARERARAGEAGLDGAVGVHGQRERRPGERRVPLDERRAADLAGHRDAGAPARGLGEADPAVADLGLGAQVGHRERLERVAERPEPHRGRPDHPPARVARVEHAGAVGLHGDAEPVAEAEAVRVAQRLGVAELVGRRVVVVRHAEVEGGPHGARDRF